MKEFQMMYEGMNGGITDPNIKQWIKKEKKKEKEKSIFIMSFSDRARFTILICDNLL